ncbi:MAG: Gfo/Idh/MocA family oxidoreductase [Proteobacteria bacterium]|nr:Gfo/Idh/MocA family oxidoreductase [Pseudomonadota bacterium]
MKTLFIGLGSIGQRHLNNLFMLLGKDVEVFAYRKTHHNRVFVDGESREVKSLQEYYNYIPVDSFYDGLDKNPEAVFITNPSSEHINMMIPAAEKGCHIFVEKPLSNSMEGVDKIESLTESKGLSVMVGFQTRFNPCYKIVNKILRQNKFGKVVSAHFEWGTYLPSHHPYEDYRQSYAARKDLGGGVVLGLMHELDMICSFWGQPQNISVIGGRLGLFEIDVEDTVSVLMEYRKENYSFPVSLFLSYAQTKENRWFRIQFEKATLFCNLTESNLRIFGQLGEMIEEYIFHDFQRNTLFVEELKEFITAIKDRRDPQVTLYDGVESLKLALKIKANINE